MGVVLVQLGAELRTGTRIAVAEMGHLVAQHGIGFVHAQHPQQRNADEQRTPFQLFVADRQWRLGHEEVGVYAGHDLVRRCDLQARRHMTDAAPQQRCIGLGHQLTVNAVVAVDPLEDPADQHSHTRQHG